MPFPSLQVKPKFLCQGIQQGDEVITLQEFNNFTLSNLIRQLADLTGHAELILSNISSISINITERLKELKGRIGQMEKMVADFDSTKEEVGGGMGSDRKAVYKAQVERSRFFEEPQEIATCGHRANVISILQSYIADNMHHNIQLNLTLNFQADHRTETGLFVREKCPPEVIEIRIGAEEMPKLHMMDEYRTDNKLSAKIYSNPDLFFLAWQDNIQAMIAEQHYKLEKKVKKTMNRSHVRRVKRAKPSRIEEAQKLRKGIEFVEDDSGKTEETEDYYYEFDDDDWSSSDGEESMGDRLEVSDQHKAESISSDVTNNSEVSLTVPATKATHGLPNTRKYSFHDITIPPPVIKNHYPPPPSPPPLDSLNLNGDLPPPINHDYSGLSANYNIQNVLISMDSKMWGNGT